MTARISGGSPHTGFSILLFIHGLQAQMISFFFSRNFRMITEFVIFCFFFSNNLVKA